MIVERLSTFAKTGIFYCAKSQLLCQRQNLQMLLLACTISSHAVTKNIEYISHGNQINTSNRVIQNLNYSKDRPLLVLLSWLYAKRKHVMKYINLYKEQGFDVLIVSMTPWELMWPMKGSKLVAADLLTFLIKHQNYQQIVLHGFSVGGYLWGEVLDLIESDRQEYKNVIDRIVGQVWDSAADITELTIGVPRAIFPHNEVLQNMLQKYLEYHLKTFYKQSTQHYIRSSQLFHSNLVHSPALFFLSKTDPVGTLSSNLKVKDRWDSLGVETYIKIFEKSPHVGHYRKYPKEYATELYAFLNKLRLIENEEKIRTHF
ncbi:unnamed protein product [Xylocopa violacea]|uniref:Transmembrane protein 53 n=1 Tax=Xylocopa violacea TaxID=135666 RepID=A0ABP1N7X6_XYLVO